MDEAEEIKALLDCWEIAANGEPRSYRAQEFLGLLETIRPKDAAALMRSLASKGLIHSDFKRDVSLTQYGLRFFPRNRLEEYSRTKRNTMPTGVESEWHDFRKLLEYYIACVKAEDRKEYHLNVEKDGLQFFIPDSVPVNWLQPKDSPYSPEFIVSFQPSSFPMLQAVMNSSERDSGVCIGYPLEASFDSSGEAYRYTPLFLIPVSCVGMLPGGTTPGTPKRCKIKLNFNEASYNYEWIVNNCDMSYYEEMLECIDDNGNGLDVAKTMETIIAYSRYRSMLAEINPNKTVQALPIVTRKGQRRRLCNTVALFRTGSSIYSKSLLKELNAIHKADASDLDRTALAYIFRKHPLPVEKESSYVPIPFMNSNIEQLDAISRAFSNHISVLQGPPGTGKSQVAVNLIANCVYNGMSVAFTSRNHAALDAIRDRAKHVIDSEKAIQLVQYCRTEDKQSIDWFDINPKEAAEAVLANENAAGQTAEAIVDGSSSAIASISKVFEEEDRKLSDYLLIENEYLAAVNKLRSLLFNAPSDAPLEDILDLASVVASAGRKGIPGFVYRLLHKSKLAAAMEKLLDGYHVIPAYRTDRDEALSALCRELSSFSSAYFTSKRRCNIAYEAYSTEEQREDFAKKYNAALDDMTRNSRAALLYRWCSSVRKLSEDDFEYMNRQLAFSKKTYGKWESSDDLLRQARIDEKLHSIVPAWAVSLLSAIHSAPLFPGIFDMVIIDEASQCDCVSMIPMLYRAMNAAVIGDPEQFRPIITMTKRRHDRIWSGYFKDSSECLPFEYYSNSAYSIVKRNAPSGMLKEHFRCDSDIAGFISEVFYNGELRVLTDRKNLNFPSCFNEDEHFQWIDISSGLEAEIAECVNKISLIESSGFSGSIGVVTPHRSVADRLANEIYANGYSEKDIKVSTAYGFQGGECDVIVFVLGYLESSPDGKPIRQWYLTDESNRNIYNVALSRAKSCLIIIGNREKCRTSESRVLRRLADYPLKVEKTAAFESPWEKRLFNALAESGIKTYPQYTFHGYRFDLAYMDENVNLDIEVDGYRYHFNDDGSRKIGDFRRDAVVERYGWKPVRFLVHDLMEDMPGCVDRIRAEIKHAENRRVVESAGSEIVHAPGMIDALASALRSNPTTACMHPCSVAGLPVDFIYDQADMKLAVLISDASTVDNMRRYRQILTKQNWNVRIYPRSQAVANPQGVVSEICSCLEEMFDSRSVNG